MVMLALILPFIFLTVVASERNQTQDQNIRSNSSLYIPSGLETNNDSNFRQAVHQNQVQHHNQSSSRILVEPNPYIEDTIIPIEIPVSFIETSPTNISAPSITTDSFVCSAEYTYLSSADATNNRASACAQVPYWGIYRLESGGSTDGTGFSCRSRPYDPRTLSNAVCVNTTIVDLTLYETDTDTCPSGFALISYEEFQQDTALYCNLLTGWEIARIGARGGLWGPQWHVGCNYSEFADHGVGHVVCVNRTLNDIQTFAINEDVCGSGRTLVTVAEAIAAVQSYCNLLPSTETGRLAGGASMDGPGLGCTIRERDRRQLNYAICGRVGRR